MNKVLLGILREIGIAVVIFVIVTAGMVFVFKDQLPFDAVVPSGEQYVQVNMKDYSVTSTDRISEINAVTITHEANQGQIIAAENEVRIQTGKYTPFGSINGTTDLPTERVGVTASVSENNETSSSSSGENSTETLSYPETSNDLIEKIDQDQSESSESAASRRMGNE